MSKKQNKKKAELKRKSNTREIERQLLKTRYPLECEAIPIEALKEEEQKVVNKCLNYENLNDTEFTLLKRILAQYRPHINKYNPKETAENVEKTVQMIETEQELIDLLTNTENKKLLVHLQVKGQIRGFNFEILPMEDSRVVQSLETQLSIFQDFTEEEMQIYAKDQMQMKMTREEQQILKKMNEIIDKKAGAEENEIMNTLLASQLRLPNSNQSFNKRKEFWDIFPYLQKVSIFMKVEEELGLTEQKNVELFPASQ